MPDICNLYISAASDLEEERESISRAVAEIPVTLGWRVVQTPIHGELVDQSAITQADYHIFVLASDIRAPVGLEWRMARSAHHMPTVFLKQTVIRTMAAHGFIRFIEEQTTWRKFINYTDLRQQCLKLLGEHILERATYYILKASEIEALSTWLKTLKEPSQETMALYGGIGESSVVLSPERYVPSNGVLIKGKPKTVNKE